MKNFIVLALLILFNIPANIQAQNKLFIGGGLGYAAPGGYIGENYEGGSGGRILCGLKLTDKIACEAGYGSYNLEQNGGDSEFEKVLFGDIALSVRYYLGQSQSVIKRYFSLGVALSAFAWEYTSEVKELVEVDDDLVGAVSFLPGLGVEFALGESFSLYLDAKYSINQWRDETANGYELHDFTGNATVVNGGILIKL